MGSFIWTQVHGGGCSQPGAGGGGGGGGGSASPQVGLVGEFQTAECTKVYRATCVSSHLAHDRDLGELDILKCGGEAHHLCESPVSRVILIKHFIRDRLLGCRNQAFLVL